jgi:lambda family phage portal protein
MGFWKDTINYFKKIFVRSYDAAKNNGANKLYRPHQASGQQEISTAWQNVTNVIRDLDRNNSHVAGMRRRFTWGLIGEGNWPRPKILKKKAANRFDFDKDLNFEILQRWEDWSKHASANGDSIYQLQRIAANSFFIDGGILIHKVYKKGKLRLEAIELDQLDNSYDYDSGQGSRIVDGIEIDEYNEPIAYYIRKRFPTEISSKTIRVSAKDILNLFDRERASSVRGISRLAPSAMNMKNINSFRSDTMTLARTATGYGIFIETPNPEDYFNQSSDSHDEDIDYIDPGAVRYLRPGEKASVVNSQHPATNYTDFIKSELQSASVGTGMSYESVSNDGSNTNFSGSRQMLLFERAMIRATFAIFEEQFYSGIYEWFVDNEVYFNGLRMPNYEAEKSRYLRCSWSRPRTEWVDPLKDAKTAREEIDMGANTLTEFCEVNGKDIEEIVATKKYEKELFENAGLNVPETITGDSKGDDENAENDKGNNSDKG